VSAGLAYVSSRDSATVLSDSICGWVSLSFTHHFDRHALVCHDSVAREQHPSVRISSVLASISDLIHCVVQMFNHQAGLLHCISL